MLSLLKENIKMVDIYIRNKTESDVSCFLKDRPEYFSDGIIRFQGYSCIFHFNNEKDVIIFTDILDKYCIKYKSVHLCDVTIDSEDYPSCKKIIFGLVLPSFINEIEIIQNYEKSTEEKIRESITMNLLEETIAALKHHGKTIDEITCVKIKDSYCWWREFEKIADFDYERVSGKPGNEKINPALQVIGHSWWLDRCIDPDGYEGWSFKAAPLHDPSTIKKIILTKENIHQ